MKTFSPVVKTSTIRLIFSLVATHNWSIQQIDVNNAFLNGELIGDIYMPQGFVDYEHPDYVCKLHKSLYGLKQTPRAWYNKLKSYLFELGFKRSALDLSLFHRKLNDVLLIVLVYVDDIPITGDSAVEVLGVIDLLNKKFKLKSLG